MRISLGSTEVGDGCATFIIAEGGICANGDIGIAERMTDAAADAGADAIKWQMRDVETVYGRAPYPEGYLDAPREHPFGGEQTQRGQKLALEFSVEEHAHLMAYAAKRGLQYTVSAWDERSLSRAVELGVAWLKVASPCVTDGPLMRAHGATGLPLVISTGGLDMDGVLRAIEAITGSEPERHCGDGGETCFDIGLARVPDPERSRYAAVDVPPMALLHCCSSYPSEDADLNLRAIKELQDAFYYQSTPLVPVGYSGHERGIATTVAAVALGACIVERHLTLDRSMHGSDQSASLEPGAFARMVRDIRAVEAALGDGVKRMRPAEEAVMRKLRRYYVCEEG